MSEWQPIETAPVDQEILACRRSPDEDTEWWFWLGKWDGKDFEDTEGFGNGATHWMPLPEPPS